MKKLTQITWRWVGLPGTAVALSLAMLTWLTISCSTDKQAGAVTAGNSAPSATEKGGAQLWADNCQRCHNTRSPSTYNDAQWEVAMMHMRVRANLTPEEHKQILAFLKSGK
jgi:cytochrome c5